MESLPTDILHLVLASGWTHAQLCEVRATCRTLRSAVDSLQTNALDLGRPVKRWTLAMEQHALPQQAHWQFGNVHAFHFVIQEWARDSSENLYKRAADFATVPVQDVYLHRRMIDFEPLHARNLGTFIARAVPLSLAPFTGMRTLRMAGILVPFSVHALVEHVPQCSSFQFEGTVFVDSAPLTAQFQGRLGLHAFASAVYQGANQWFPFAEMQTDVSLEGVRSAPLTVTDVILDLFPRVRTLRLLHCVTSLTRVRFNIVALLLNCVVRPKARLLPHLRHLHLIRDDVTVFQRKVTGYPLLQSVTLQSPHLYKTFPATAIKCAHTLETMPVYILGLITATLDFPDMLQLRWTSRTLKDHVSHQAQPQDPTDIQVMRTMHSRRAKFLDGLIELPRLRIHYGNKFAFKVQTDASTSVAAMERCVRHGVAFADLHCSLKMKMVLAYAPVFYADRCIFSEMSRFTVMDILARVKTSEVVLENVPFADHLLQAILDTGVTKVTVRILSASLQGRDASLQVSTVPTRHYEMHHGVIFLDSVRDFATRAVVPFSMTLTDMGYMELDRLPGLHSLHLTNCTLIVRTPLSELEELTMINAQCLIATPGLFPSLQRLHVQDVQDPSVPLLLPWFNAPHVCIQQSPELAPLYIDGKYMHEYPPPCLKRRRPNPISSP